MRIYFWWCERDVVKKLDAPEEHLGISGLWEKLNNPNFKGVEIDPFWLMGGTSQSEF